MKKTLKYIFILLALSACDDRFNFLATYNSPPVITLTGTGNNTQTAKSTPQGTTTGVSNKNSITLLDSVKISLKHGALNYTFTINLSDPDHNITEISMAMVSGQAKLSLNNSDVPSPIPTNLSTLMIGLSEFQEGQIEVDLQVKDAFGSVATIRLVLIAFKNIAPDAAFTYAVNNVNGDPYQYSFDASSSIDMDARFGGDIQAYSWTVNGVKYPNITSPLMNQVFPGPGGYQVSLVVYDNDGAPSQTVTKQIVVQ